MSEDKEENGSTPNSVHEAARNDIAEKPGTDSVGREHEEELVDEWEQNSFPASDPPAHY